MVLGIACLQSASAQSFKKAKVAKNAPIVQVASGGASVWALASNGNPYVFNGKSFVLANSISLSQIAVGGGNAAQADAIWALDSAGNIFHASKSGTSWTFSHVAGALDLIKVGIGYHDSCHPYEVWGLNTGSQIYRYNYCTNSFDQEPGFLCDLQVGGEDVWGAECGPKVFQFDFGSGAFDQINDPFAAFPVLAAGPAGVWAIDTGDQSIYQYSPFVGFQQVVTCCSQQIYAGGDGVWFLSGTAILRLNPNTTYFAQVSGVNSPTSISVGSGGGVWAVDSSHQVFAFSTP